MTSEGFGEMSEGDFVGMYTEKFPLISMGGRDEGLVCADLVARTPIVVSGNLIFSNIIYPFIKGIFI